MIIVVLMSESVRREMRQRLRPHFNLHPLRPTNFLTRPQNIGIALKRGLERLLQSESSRRDRALRSCLGSFSSRDRDQRDDNQCGNNRD